LYELIPADHRMSYDVRGCWKDYSTPAAWTSSNLASRPK